MQDYLSLGPVPFDEKCESVGPNYDERKAMAESKRYIDTIRQALGPEPMGAKLKVTRNPHDFGEYLDVVCYYDEAYIEAVDYAYRCEAEGPRTWT
jgi:hypothetical protein